MFQQGGDSQHPHAHPVGQAPHGHGQHQHPHSAQLPQLHGLVSQPTGHMPPPSHLAPASARPLLPPAPPVPEPSALVPVPLAEVNRVFSAVSDELNSYMGLLGLCVDVLRNAIPGQAPHLMEGPTGPGAYLRIEIHGPVVDGAIEGVTGSKLRIGVVWSRSNLTKPGMVRLNEYVQARLFLRGVDVWLPPHHPMAKWFTLPDLVLDSNENNSQKREHTTDTIPTSLSGQTLEVHLFQPDGVQKFTIKFVSRATMHRHRKRHKE